MDEQDGQDELRRSRRHFTATHRATRTHLHTPLRLHRFPFPCVPVEWRVTLVLYTQSTTTTSPYTYLSLLPTLLVMDVLHVCLLWLVGLLTMRPSPLPVCPVPLPGTFAFLTTHTAPTHLPTNTYPPLLSFLPVPCLYLPPPCCTSLLPSPPGQQTPARGIQASFCRALRQDRFGQVDGLFIVLLLCFSSAAGSMWLAFLLRKFHNFFTSWFGTVSLSCFPLSLPAHIPSSCNKTSCL